MNEALVRDGDTWLKDHLSSYAEWAKVHNSLLIVTFDEDDDHAGNHYNVFSTLLAMYNLSPFATAVTSLPIYSIWEQ